jgi:aminopeptidase N
VDQTAGTTPLWQALDNLDQAKSNYGAIVYNKAPAVLKQLNYLVGEPAFRSGVQTFLARHAFANATWRDLLTEIGRAADRRLDDFGRQFILRPGMPEVEQRLTIRGGRIARLDLVERPVQTLSGPAPWPMRTQVLLGYGDAPPKTIPVELAGTVTEIPEAVGERAPAFVFANAGDYGYMLTRLDTASLAALEGGALAGVADGFLRAMLWGALWDEVRAARLDPAAFVRIALRDLPRERDEQIVPRVLARVRRALAAYLGTAQREQLQGDVERLLWAGAGDTTAPPGLRKAYLDAYVSTAATPAGIQGLATIAVSDSAAGTPVGNPTRWEAVTRLLVLGAPDVRRSGHDTSDAPPAQAGPGTSATAPDAERLLAAQAARDPSPDGRRRAFIAGAARGDSATKRTYFERYFADAALNEDWASGSLGAFNAPEHQDLTLPYLKPALDSLRFIQANRRIFFLGSWLGAFLGGQTSDAALGTVRRFLSGRVAPDVRRSAHETSDAPPARTRRSMSAIAPDLRRKVEEYADELERTVRIRQRFVAAPPEAAGGTAPRRRGTSGP